MMRASDRRALLSTIALLITCALQQHPAASAAKKASRVKLTVLEL